jgi:hypothetical protein
MKRTILVVVFVFMTLAMTLYPACATTQTTTYNPSVPAGLNSINLPDISLNGFVYLNQGQTFTVPGGTVSGIKYDIGIDSASVFFGPDEDSIGGTLTVGTGTDIKTILSAMETQTEVWAASKANNLHVSLNTTDWDKSLQGVLTDNKTVPALKAYPDIYQTFSYFPASPPEKPLAGGFINLTGGLSDSITKMDSNIGTVLQAIKAVNINDVNFILYGPKVTKLPIQLDESTLTDYSLLLVGKSGFSATLLNISFDTILKNAGITRTDSNGLTAYSYSANGIPVLVSRKDNIIYAALASNQDAAYSLLSSAVK